MSEGEGEARRECPVVASQCRENVTAEQSAPAPANAGAADPDVWSRLEREVVWEGDVADMILEAVAEGRRLRDRLVEVEAERDRVIEELTTQRQGGAA